LGEESRNDVGAAGGQAQGDGFSPDFPDRQENRARFAFYRDPHFLEELTQELLGFRCKSTRNKE
jgi:hypothetical protein